MDSHSPRHARQTCKRHQAAGVKMGVACALVTALAALVTAVAQLISAICPPAGQPVAPGPSVVCYAVNAPAYCPAAPSP